MITIRTSQMFWCWVSDIGNLENQFLRKWKTIKESFIVISYHILNDRSYQWDSCIINKQKSTSLSHFSGAEPSQLAGAWHCACICLQTIFWLLWNLFVWRTSKTSIKNELILKLQKKITTKRSENRKTCSYC